jgi:hypothetical protein
MHRDQTDCHEQQGAGSIRKRTAVRELFDEALARNEAFPAFPAFPWGIAD